MHELLTGEEMAEADRRTVSLGVPSLTLMENAGRAVADEAAKMVSPGAKIAVLCGPGNNGGDGFVAARYLKERGFDVRVACLVSVDQLKGDAAEMAGRWGGEVADGDEIDLYDIELIIDALFGAGFSRSIDGQASEFYVASTWSDAGALLSMCPVDCMEQQECPMVLWFTPRAPSHSSARNPAIS